MHFAVSQPTVLRDYLHANSCDHRIESGARSPTKLNASCMCYMVADGEFAPNSRTRASIPRKESPECVRLRNGARRASNQVRSPPQRDVRTAGLPRATEAYRITSSTARRTSSRRPSPSHDTRSSAPPRAHAAARASVPLARGIRPCRSLRAAGRRLATG